MPGSESVRGCESVLRIEREESIEGGDDAADAEGEDLAVTARTSASLPGLSI
jgi:hypothetical protein